jgi:GTP-binding protein EngB required for normal cell division
MTQIGTDLPGRDDYLIENLKQTGLQKEERPLGSTVEWQDYLITTETFELLIDNNGMEVNFKTAYVKAFYEKYFTPEMLECELAAQSAFEFKVPVHSIDEFSEFKNLSNVYLPEEYKKQIARPANLLITREEENIFSSAVNAIFPHWSFIAIDKNEMRFCTAAKVKITERVLDKPVNINLLVEQSYGIEQKQAIFDKCESFLNEKNNTEKVEILLEANKVPSDSEWKLIAENCANKIYGELISELTKENVEFFAKIAKKLDNIRKLEKDVLLNDVSNKLSSEITDEVELFNFLLKAGFNENESLSVANVIKNYVKKALAGVSELEKSPISDKFSSLANCLKNLKENTLRDDKFIADFKAYKSRLSNLKKYEGFAPDEFKELFDYKETMQAEFESLMAKRNSSQNPGKVNKESIRNKIDVGEYRAAVIEMAIPLEYVLGKLLKIEKNNDNKLVKTINIARDKRILTEEQAQTLHEFRQIRNQLLHSTQAQPKLDREKVSKWANVIFNITEKPEDKK